MTTHDILVSIDRRLGELKTESGRLEAAKAQLIGPANGVVKPTASAAATKTPQTPRRARNGDTMRVVLGALDESQARTAADVAQTTRVSRPVVSSTLTRLAKQGLATKAARGYLRTTPAA